MSPSEQISAIVTGWAVAWMMVTVGIDPTPCIIVGLLAAAATAGKYRRRWANPPRPTTEP